MSHGNLTANGHNSLANGTGAGVVKGNRVDALISNVFVATVQLQMRDTQGNWLPNGADITAPGVRYVEGGQQDREWRLMVTAYTSGTITYELSGSRDRNLEA